MSSNREGYRGYVSSRDFGGLRNEEDFLITADGSRRLGPPKPVRIEEIEALRRG